MRGCTSYAREKDLFDAKRVGRAKGGPNVMKAPHVIEEYTDRKFFYCFELIYSNSTQFFQFQFSHLVIRYPLSVIRYPLSVIRYPLSVLWRGKIRGGD